MSHPDRSLKKSKSGLTLVEIMVVATIFSILVVSLFTVFKGGLDSWRKAETLLDIYNSARTSLDMMEREISSAFLYQDANYTQDTSKYDKYWTAFLGTTAGSRIKTNSIGDEVFFVAPIQGNQGMQDLCESGYWLRGDNCLMRHYEFFDNSVLPVVYDFTKRADLTADTGANDSVVARNVTALQFTYFYRHAAGAAPIGVPALHTWNSSVNTLTGATKNYDSNSNELIPDGLPDAVSVSITIQSRDGSQSRTFTDFIRVIGVK